MRRKGLKVRELSVVFRQLADALQGGLSLRDAAAILAKISRGEREESKALLQRWIEVLEKGSPMSAALALDPKLFPPETVSMVRDAEQREALPDVLAMVAKDLEFRAELSTGMQGVMAWPAFAAGFLVLILMITMIFVIPTYKDLFKSFGADLPGPTIALIWLSDFVASYFYLVFLAAIAAVVYGFVRGFSLARLPWLDDVAIRLPFLRDYLRHTFTVRLAQVLALAGRERVPVGPALAYLRATAGNRNLGAVARSLEAHLADGKDLVGALWDAPLVPRELAAAVEISLRGGNVAGAMDRVAAFSEAEAARSLLGFQQAVMFAMYVAIGAVVGLVVIAMYLPIFKMGSAI